FPVDPPLTLPPLAVGGDVLADEATHGLPVRLVLLLEDGATHSPPPRPLRYPDYLLNGKSTPYGPATSLPPGQGRGKSRCRIPRADVSLRDASVETPRRPEKHHRRPAPRSSLARTDALSQDHYLPAFGTRKSRVKWRNAHQPVPGRQG